MTEAVKLAGVSLSLPVEDREDLEILKGIDFSIEAGSKCGLVGPSGSGKTSLLTLIAGLRKPSAGQINILDESIVEMDEEQLADFRRANIGVVFQNFHLLPAMTALENAAIPLELAGAADAEERAYAALSQVGLKERARHYPHQLSGGEQQRTAIARAFVASPKLVLADEPTGNLDGKTSENVMETLEELIRTNKTTMLLITHNEALLDGVGQVARMNSGQLSVAAA
ncbi:MAG: ABC transporter ATP-binding protein [Betaproteobacteria bacterium AqS2]|uniref:ABC transporter ATP-binding protein n=1 Tax=Candidatus Amphirhobacter heronislandensis TaxID=1732024 RepID=A0A930XVZ9_9GAMM|nr:ABC transporter ATP-binding protein [Betaproteobacteria bacterium AqS2]